MNLTDLNVILTGNQGLARVTRGVALLYNYLLSYDTKQYEDEFAPEYVQISYATLQAFIGKENYLSVLHRLLDNQYLERLDYDEDGQYYPEGFYRVADDAAGLPGRCKAFRIPARLIAEGRGYQTLEIALTKTEINKIENVKRARVEFEEPNREFIRQNMLNVALVDTIESRSIIDKLYVEGSIRVDAERFLDMWNNNLFHEPSVDSFGKRVHSPITSMPRELRPFLRFRNDMESPLMEIDFVASQPSLLASITPRMIKKYAPECAAAIPLFQAIENDKDWVSYRATCLDNRPGQGIYEFLARAFEKTFGTSMSRDNGKAIYYRACFSNYRAISHLSLKNAEGNFDWHMSNGDERSRQQAASHLFTLRSYHVFKAAFPGVHRLFRELKRLSWNVDGGGAPHANNCLLAQRIESGLVYTTLVKALKKANVTQVVTIHDALFVRQHEEARARKLIQNELHKLKLNLRLKSK